MTVKYAPHTSTEAMKRAKSYVGKAVFSNMCQSFVVTIFGTGSVYDYDGDGHADAEDGYKKSLAKGKFVKAPTGAAALAAFIKTIPAGVKLDWTGGSHDFGHTAVSIGGGEMVCTDSYEGKWGKVGIQDIGYVTKYWGNGLVLRGYELVDGNGFTLTDKPAPKPVEPPFWFGIDFRNFAGFDVVHGAATFDKRLPAIVKDIAAVNRAFVCAVEIPNGKVAAVTAALSKVGYDHLAGDLGRHIFAHKGIKADAAKMFDLKPRYKADTKQGVGVIAKPTGGYAVGVCTAQLENEDATGATQVGQAGSLMDQFEAFCDSHNIADSRRFYALDTNSDNRVRDEVFAKRGYVDAFDVAWSSENSVWRSIVKWFGKPTKGKRIDLFAVRKGRPVRRARLRTTTSNLSDHVDGFVDIGSL